MSEPSICILFALTGSCSRSSCTCLHEEVKSEIKKLCPFFNSKTGCKKGALCLHQHKLLEYKSKKSCKYFNIGKCRYDDDKCPCTHYMCICRRVAEETEDYGRPTVKCNASKCKCICTTTYTQYYGENAAFSKEILISEYC